MDQTIFASSYVYQKIIFKQRYLTYTYLQNLQLQGIKLYPYKFQSDSYRYAIGKC